MCAPFDEALIIRVEEEKPEKATLIAAHYTKG